MAKVYCHRPFTFTDAARQRDYSVDEDQVLELPEEVAQWVASEHIDKVCLLSPSENPKRHRCELSKALRVERRKAQQYVDTELADPPVHRMMTSLKGMAPGRRKTLRAALKRSRVARARYSGQVGVIS